MISGRTPVHKGTPVTQVVVNRLCSDFIVFHVVNPLIKHRELNVFQEGRGIEIVIVIEHIIRLLVVAEGRLAEVVCRFLFNELLKGFIKSDASVGGNFELSLCQKIISLIIWRETEQLIISLYTT